MPEATLGEKLNRWKTLADAMAPPLDEFPHLRDDSLELRSAVQTIEALMVEEDLHESRLRGTTSRRREIEARCLDHAARIVTGLQSHFGKRSQELRQFGIDPLLPANRKKKDDEPPSTPQTPDS